MATRELEPLVFERVLSAFDWEVIIRFYFKIVVIPYLTFSGVSCNSVSKGETLREPRGFDSDIERARHSKAA
jgi:hypothetical protein